MSFQPRSSIHSVAQSSRHRCLRKLSVIGLFAVRALMSQSAGATESTASAAGPKVPPPVDAETYEGPLAVAYLAAPLLALATGAGVFEGTHDDTVAVAASALMFLTPAAVHVYHGASEQAGVSFGSMLGLTLLGTLVGGATGYIVGDLRCDDDVESDCDTATIGPTIFGAIAGTFAGYIGHAIYDVSSNAVVPSAGPATSKSVSVWLAPTRAGIERQPASAAGVSGLKVGATVSF